MAASTARMPPTSSRPAPTCSSSAPAYLAIRRGRPPRLRYCAAGVDPPAAYATGAPMRPALAFLSHLFVPPICDDGDNVHRSHRFSGGTIMTLLLDAPEQTGEACKLDSCRFCGLNRGQGDLFVDMYNSQPELDIPGVPANLAVLMDSFPIAHGGAHLLTTPRRHYPS